MALDKLTKLTSQSGITTTIDYQMSDLTVDTITVQSGGIKMPVGMSTFQNVTVTGNLTVNGTTTTLDTDLIGVDKLEVSGSNTTAVGIITQAGSGDILRLYDSTTEVFKVADGGNVTTSGSVGIADSIIHVGNTDTSIRFPADDTFTVETGGSERLRVNSDGTITQGTIQVDGAEGGSAQIRLRADEGDDNNDMYRLLVEDGGNGLKIQGYDGSFQTRLTIDTSGNVDIATGHLSLDNDKGIFFDGTTTTKDTIWRNSSENSLNMGSRYHMNLFIDSNNDDTNAYFAVNKDHTTKASATELFRVQSDGKVGIGTDSPSELLEIANSVACGIAIKDDDNGFAASKIKVENGGRDLAIGAPQDIFFKDIDTGTKHLYIESTGHIGIGTDNPTSILHLSGSAPRITLTDTAGTNDYAKIFSTGGALYLQQRDDSAHGNIVFRTEDNSGASEKLRIRSTGQVEFKNGSFSDNVDCVMGNGGELTLGAQSSIKFRTATNQVLFIDSNGLISNRNRAPSDYGSPQLLIGGGSSTLTMMGDGSTNNSSYTGIKFRVAGGSTGDYTKAGIFAQRQGGYNDLALIFAMDTVADATSVSIADEKMRITSAGRVGIGTVTPESLPLTVAGSTAAIALVDTDRTNSNYYSAVWGDQSGNLHLVADYEGAAGSQFMSARIGGTALSNEKLRIQMNGSIGINTTLTYYSGGNPMLNIAAATQAFSSGTDLADGGGIMFQPTDTMPSTGRSYPGIFWAGNTTSLNRMRAGIVGVTASNHDATHIAFLTRHGADGSALTPADEQMRLTKDGVLLVGHSSSPTSDGDKIQAVSTSGGHGICLHNYSASAYGNQIAFMKSRNGTIGGNTILNTGDRIGELNFYGNDGTNRSLGAQISVRVDASPGNDNTPSAIYLMTGTNQSMNTRLSVKSNGCVGVSKNGWSTSDNSFALTVHTGATSDSGDPVNDGIMIVSQNSSGNQNSTTGKLMFCGHAQVNGPFLYADNTQAYGKKDLVFHTRSTANDYTTQVAETLRLTKWGHFGLGTETNIDSLMHIQGTSDNGDEYCQMTIEDTDDTAGSRIPSIQFKGNGTNTWRIRGTDASGLQLASWNGSAQVTRAIIGNPDEAGAFLLYADDRGWGTFRWTNNTGMRTHVKVLHSPGNAVATYTILRIRRHNWGWGNYKIRCKEIYYSGSYETTYMINGHGVNGDYYHVHKETFGSDASSNDWSACTITETASSSSPGSSGTWMTDIKINIPNYRYAIIYIEAWGGGYSTDPTSMTTNSYCLM